jgi:hypothetical protein
LVDANLGKYARSSSSGQDPKGLFDTLVEFEGFERSGLKLFNQPVKNLSGLHLDNNDLIPN